MTDVIARTDWYVVSDGRAFDTLNLANLTGFARLAWQGDAPVRGLIEDSLAGPIAAALGGGLDEARFSLAGHEGARVALGHAPQRSWEVMSKTAFVLQHVFHEDCMVPHSQLKAWMMLTDIHGIADWDPSLEGALRLDDAGMAGVFREKD